MLKKTWGPMPELTWELEETPCLLCKSTDSRAIARREQPRHVICRRCGMVYQNPRPTISSIMPYYNSGYWKRERPTTRPAWQAIGNAAPQSLSYHAT